jgi:hypothetical protein
MAVPQNILVQVQTYQKTELAYLLNSFAGISLANKKFKNFNTTAPSNLGDTVTFDRGPRYITYNGLVITQQQSDQLVQSLTASQSSNVSAAYTDQQFIFNVRDYMDRFGESAVKELGTKIESDILKNFISGVYINDPQNPAYGTQTVNQVNSGPYRFYGDGVTQINSFGQLAQAVANFEDYGAAKNKMIAIIPTTSMPQIVNTGLQQFVPGRNEKIANSWELGEFSGVQWYKSNLLPTQIAGYVGQAAAPNNIITVVSVNDTTGNNVTQITFTEPAGSSLPNPLNPGDLVQFNDGVSGFSNMRFLTYIGHVICQQPVQFRVLSCTASVSGTFTATIQTTNGVGLVWAQNLNQNLNQTIQTGMKCTVLPSHKAGILMSGNEFYLAMPQLPDQEPFSTVNQQDKDSGASIRHYWGVQFGQNVRSYVRDSIWGSTLVSENCMRLIFPM